VFQNLYAPWFYLKGQMISLTILYQIEARKKLRLLVLNDRGYEDLSMSNFRDFQKFDAFFGVEK
jgi:hypothetical protein